MRRQFISRHALLAVATLVGLGLGCGSNGLGCGGSASLPSMPAPWGFPMNQAIEGGMQARITQPGFSKISALIPALAKSALPTQATPQCLGEQNFSLEIAGTGANARACGDSCGGGGPGCPIWVSLRPDIAPPGGIALSMADGDNPVINVDAAFDVHMQVPLQYQLCVFGICGGWNTVCTLDVDAPATHVKAGIQLGIDPTTGKLTIALGSVDLVGLNLATSNCGFASDLFNAVLGIINTVATSFIGNAIIGLLTPTLSNLIDGILPNPPGLATRLDLSGVLGSFGAPKEAALELLAIAGGYVSAKSGGLNLGVITGANSDADPTTRAAGQDPINSEPSLCVPNRPTYDLGGAPWNLPVQALRQDHDIDPAAQFAGNPDPVDSMGNLQDIALGVSRTFLDLLGFHLYNSGGLCLTIGASTLGSNLSAGTLRILVPSLGNILTDPKAPVELVIRPEQPLLFQVGAGGMADPLLKIAATDLRIDFYAFVEQRYIRLFTLAADLNIGLDLAVTMDSMGNPAIGIMLSGLDAQDVTLRVSNTDVLSEDPVKLAKSLGSLLGVAVGQLGGGIKPISLPSISGFSLDGLAITRVQTPEDDFVAIFGTLAQDPNAMPYALPETLVGLHRLPDTIDTTAELLDVSAPPPEVIQAAAEQGRMGDGDTPSITLKLGGTGTALEWSYRVDGGWWRPWSSDPHPTIADAAFLIQGKHVVDVRARNHGDWTSEDQTPARLTFVIDSVPPELTLGVEADKKIVSLQATDNVSDVSALRFAWKTPAGFTQPAARTSLTFAEVLAATANASQPLVVVAYDEQGNHSQTSLNLHDVGAFNGLLDGPQASTGCACAIGAGGHDAGNQKLALFGLLPLLALCFRRRATRSSRHA